MIGAAVGLWVGAALPGELNLKESGVVQAAGKTESAQLKLEDQLDIRIGAGAHATLYKVCDTETGQTIYLYGNNQMELADAARPFNDCRP